MINFSDCKIVRVKSFFGHRSIDPPVSCDKFIQENLANLKSLIEKNMIIGLDDHGNEISNELLTEYILDSYEGLMMKVQLDEIYITDNKNNSADIQKDIDRIKEIDDEEKGKAAHKQRLLDSLQGCDERYKLTLERGLERHDQAIEELKNERKHLLDRINQNKIENDKY